jgi:DNA-3-methyladenine glycosylase
MSKPVPADFWTQPVVLLARALIGVTLLVDGVGGIITETEAYDIDEPASHAFRGPRGRNLVMFGPVGHAYVYKIYGIHWCLNFVGGAHRGSAALIRALEPTHGLDRMIERRGLADPRTLCSGPGKLAQALGIDHALNGAALDRPPFALFLSDKAEKAEIVTGPRIGITKAADLPWRFGLGGSRYWSRAFPKDDRSL